MRPRITKRAGHYQCVSWAFPRAVGIGKTKEEAYEAWIINAKRRKAREDRAIEEGRSYFYNPIDAIDKTGAKETLAQRIKRWFK